MKITVRVMGSSDRAWVGAFAARFWGSESVVSRGNLYENDDEIRNAARSGRPETEALLRLIPRYFEARYGERGRLFTRSDSAWLVTLADLDEGVAIDQIDWLARVLSRRGMPSLLLEKHLFRLQETLIHSVPERARRYRRLGALAVHLRAKRVAAVPDFDRVAASFHHSEPLANVGPIIVGAAADERLGVDNAAQSVESWLTDSVRFSPEWVAAVERTMAQARSSEPKWR